MIACEMKSPIKGIFLNVIVHHREQMLRFHTEAWGEAACTKYISVFLNIQSLATEVEDEDDTEAANIHINKQRTLVRAWRLFFKLSLKKGLYHKTYVNCTQCMELIHAFITSTVTCCWLAPLLAQLQFCSGKEKCQHIIPVLFKRLSSY